MPGKRATEKREPGLLQELSWRGLLHDQTPGLTERLAQGPITGYVGFDPTAKSLQVGNLVPVMLLAHLQRAGGKPIVVVGGGTGMIGDPSGRRSERPLLDAAEVDANVARQRAQLGQFLQFGGGPSDAEMVNNADWLRGLNLIAFLRDYGKHFTLSYMLQKESVKGRMEAGISYTEFSYMLLQAYDFLHLYWTQHCELQLGGSDQWGNITAGIELIRRVTGGEAHGLAAPLLVTASGAKFGKTAGGAVWLDPELTSPYQFYQFWLNVPDAHVERYLKVFTFKGADDVEDLMRAQQQDPGARAPHRALAADLTDRVHGAAARERAAQAARLLFGEADPRAAPEEVWAVLRRELPGEPLPSGFTGEAAVVDVVGAAGLVKSKSEARRLIQQHGLSWNGEPVRSADAKAGPPLAGGYYWVTVGKKTHAILYPPTA
jgi:tyrosyl-tRNA synthetase